MHEMPFDLYFLAAAGRPGAEPGLAQRDYTTLVPYATNKLPVYLGWIKLKKTNSKLMVLAVIKKVIIGFVVVLFGAGLYYQEFGWGRWPRGREPERGTAGREGGRVITRSATGTYAKVSLLDRLIQERRRDFRKVIFDPTKGGREEASAGCPTRPSGDGSPGVPLFANHSQVEGTGEVVVILGECPEATDCQKFMLRLESGKFMLIEHNTNAAPSVENLELGDEVSFFGEYTYDIDGDVIRWTHKDAKSRHVAGWIKHKGRLYQ